MFPFSQSRGGGAVVAGFSTLSTTDKAPAVLLTNNNLKATHDTSGASFANVRGTKGVLFGSGVKLQLELTFNAIGAAGVSFAGLATAAASLAADVSAENSSIIFYAYGEAYYKGTLLYQGSANAAGTVVGIVINPTTNIIDFYKNGALIFSRSIDPGTWFAFAGTYNINDALTLNVGASAFTYPISGAVAYG